MKNILTQTPKTMIRNGHHVNSKSRRDRKLMMPMLPPLLFEIAVAMILTDATLYRLSKEACMKVEQGWKQQDFVTHFFNLFQAYYMQTAPWVCINKDANSTRCGEVKSYCFKIISHATFTAIYEMLYVDGRKTLPAGVIKTHINAVGLAYMCIADGSLQSNNAIVLYTQGFTKAENEVLAAELNAKFGFAAIVKLAPARPVAPRPPPLGAGWGQRSPRAGRAGAEED